jgi:splicing factor U2AF subunit
MEWDRGGSCNYMHLKKLSSKFKKSLFKQMYEEHPEYLEKKKKKSSKSRSRSQKRKEKEKDKKAKKKTKKKNESESSTRNSEER